DFQLGIESYQIKINIIAPTLIFPDIEASDPYFIVDEPRLGLIYLNNKGEKRVMDLVEIVKFYDATLKRVLKEVKLKIFKIEFLKKAPLMGALDLKIMKTYEREITKRIRHRGSISMVSSKVGRWFSIRSIDSNDSSGLVDWWIGAGGGLVSGGGMVLGVASSSVGKVVCGANRFFGGDSRGVDREAMLSFRHAWESILGLKLEVDGDKDASKRMTIYR
ncbi:hypothetical protein Tco_1036214, partial [Tanacetum coccineum]